MITHKYTIVCDEVRQENNGKFILLGVYTPSIVVPQIPFVLPSLTFFQCLESDRPGTWSMQIRLQHLETGRTIVEGLGSLAFPQPGIGINPLKFGNVQLTAAGEYSLSIQFQDHREPFITGFNVILNLPTPHPPQMR